MTREISYTALDALERMLGQTIVTPLAGGEVQIVWGPLTRRAVSAALLKDGVLWVFIDEAKAMMRGHAAEMLAEVRACCDERGALSLRHIPTAPPGSRRAVHLQMVS